MQTIWAVEVAARIAAAVVSSTGARRPTRTTANPAAANRFAQAAPMPLPAPETTARRTVIIDPQPEMAG